MTKELEQLAFHATDLNAAWDNKQISKLTFYWRRWKLGMLIEKAKRKHFDFLALSINVATYPEAVDLNTALEICKYEGMQLPNKETVKALKRIGYTFNNNFWVDQKATDKYYGVYFNRMWFMSSPKGSPKGLLMIEKQVTE